MENELWKRKDAAKFLGVSEQTLANWAWRGGLGPPFIAINSRCIRYDRETLIAWAKSREIYPEKEAT